MPAKGWKKPPGYSGYKHRPRVDRTFTEVPKETTSTSENTDVEVSASTSVVSDHVSNRTRSAQPISSYAGQDEDAPSEISEVAENVEEEEAQAESMDEEDAPLTLRVPKKEKKACACCDR